MQWVNTLIGLGKQTNLHLQSNYFAGVGWFAPNPHGANEPTCTPLATPLDTAVHYCTV